MHLQFAHFQSGNVESAAKAAWTYFIHNPNSTQAESNLKFYRAQDAFTEDMFRIDSRDITPLNKHQSTFTEAVTAYNDGDFKAAISLFETTLDEYLKANIYCEVLCEAEEYFIGDTWPYDYNQGVQHDMETQIINHWTETMECKALCPITTVTFPGQPEPARDFLPELLNFLQFCYAKELKIDLAAKYAQSYISFHARDETMKLNLLIYKRLLGGVNRVPGPDKRILDFLQASRIKIAMLKYSSVYLHTDVDRRVFDLWPENEKKNSYKSVEDSEEEEEEDEQNKEDDDEIVYDSVEDKIEKIIEQNTKQVEKNDNDEDKNDEDKSLIIPDEEFGYYLIETKGTPVVTKSQPSTGNHPFSNLLNGVDSANVVYDATVHSLDKSIFAIDNFISPLDLKILEELAYKTVRIGDGYNKQPHPHNQNEIFSGVTLEKIAELFRDFVRAFK